MNPRPSGAFAPTVLLLVLAFGRPWLEVSMLRHMALEFPALFLAGWLFARDVRPARSQPFCAWNGAGAPAMLSSAVLLMVWMLPVVFDAAMLDWRVAMFKVATLLASGFLAGWSWPRLHVIVRSFFLLNLGGMNVLAGVLYALAPQQLCSAYVSGEQLRAGLGLIAWGALVLAGWLFWLGRTLFWQVNTNDNISGRRS